MAKEKGYKINLGVTVNFTKKPPLATLQVISDEILDNFNDLGVAYNPDIDELEIPTKFDVDWDFWLDKLPKIDEIIRKHLASHRRLTMIQSSEFFLLLTEKTLCSS